MNQSVGFFPFPSDQGAQRACSHAHMRMKLWLMLSKEIEIAVVVERRRRVLLPLILKIRPRVGAGQVDRFAAPVGEIARILRMDPQRPWGTGQGRIFGYGTLLLIRGRSRCFLRNGWSRGVFQHDNQS